MKIKLNDYENEPVPADKLRGWLDMVLIIVGVGIAVPAFFLGAAISDQLAVWEAFVAIFLGGVIFTFFAILMSLVGHKTKYTTYVIARNIFGHIGFLPIVFFIVLSLIFWFAFNLELFAQSFSALSDAFLPVWMFSVLGGLLMILTAIFGFRGLHRLSSFAVPVLLLLILSGVFIAWEDITTLFVSQTELDGSLGLFVSIVAGTFMVGAALISDLSRYTRTPKDAVIGATVGYIVAGPSILFLMYLLSAVTGSADLFMSFEILGLAFFALFTLIFATWTTNDNNLYSASLAMSSVMTKTRKWQIVIAMGILGSLIASFGVLGQLINFVLLLSITITPIIAVIATYVLLIRDHHYVYNGSVNIIAIVSWLAGALVGYATTPSESLGLGWVSLTTVPVIDAVLVAFVVLLVLDKIARHNK